MFSPTLEVFGMVQLNPYLTFDGNCRQAMEFYQKALGGELFIQTVGESPMAKETPKEFHGQIMHAKLESKGMVLMASDNMMHDKFMPGNNVALSLNCDSDEEIKRLFAALSQRGKVEMMLADQFWGATYGMLTDLFGVRWMLNFQKTPSGGM